MVNVVKENKIYYRKFKKTINEKRTNTYWFLLPILKLDKNLLVNKFKLKNAYLGNHLIEKQYKNCIHLIFDMKNYVPEFVSYLDHLSEHEYFMDIYDFDGHDNIGVVFFIDDKYLPILDLFKKGKYSEFPDWYQSNYFNKEDPQLKVFSKHEDFRRMIENKVGATIMQDAEVWSISEPETEIYMYNEKIETEW